MAGYPGIPGRIKSVWVAGYYRYGWPDDPGIRTFSAWDQIFPDKAITIAAIDRLVHHATILEMNAESFRRRAASDNQKALAAARATTSTDNKPEEKTDKEKSE